MAKPAKSDTRYLEKHGTKWRVYVAVPRKLQPVMGATKLKETLETDSLAEANRQKWAWVAEFQRRIEAVRNPQGQPEALEAEAKRLAALRRAATNDDAEDSVDAYIEQRVAEIAGNPVRAGRDGEAIYAPERERAAIQFSGVATGQRTPLEAHRERYQAQLRVKSRTLADDNRAMKYLLDWCETENIPAFLETFGRREAIRFTDAFPALICTTQARTLNKYVRRLGSYWKWMESRDEVKTNIWQGRTYTIPQETAEHKERPFTDAEMVKLLAGPAPQELHDVMRIGALTGARLDAIVSLRVKDCHGGTFTFKPQKKETGQRLCPIHSDLETIIQRRIADKNGEDWLFPEWPPAKSTKSQRERSFKTSNHFTAYRRDVGVDERREGNRRGRVNFHSFRRWFATRAEQADQPESLIAAVLGHRRQGVTLGIYSSGPQLEQAKRCVEAVKLPAFSEVAS